jgi:hypothetical protein
VACYALEMTPYLSVVLFRIWRAAPSICSDLIFRQGHQADRVYGRHSVIRSVPLNTSEQPGTMFLLFPPVPLTGAIPRFLSSAWDSFGNRGYRVSLASHRQGKEIENAFRLNLRCCLANLQLLRRRILRDYRSCGSLPWLCF